MQNLILKYGAYWFRLCVSMYKVTVVWKHFKYKTLNIKANNTLDINDIMSETTKIVSIAPKAEYHALIAA